MLRLSRQMIMQAGHRKMMEKPHAGVGTRIYSGLE